MRSPGLIFAWEFTRRHRWGFLAIAAYLVLVAVVGVQAIAGTTDNVLESERFAFTVNVPGTFAALYMLALFSFGLSGDIAARESIFPRRYFNLPVRTSALAGWPVFFAMVSIASLWVVISLIALRPAGVHLPLLWPTIFGAVFFGWTLALMWLPYPLRGMRVVVVVVLMTMFDVVVLIAMYFKVPSTTMILMLAPQIPLCYLVAHRAVTLARRGHVPTWRIPLTDTSARLTRRSFASYRSAQAWLEWRQQGRSLPVLVGLVLPFELLLMILFRDAPGLFIEVLMGVLFTPVFMATLVAAANNTSTLTTFMATRPLTDNAIIAAKLKATFRSTAVTWLLVVIAIAIALTVSDTTTIVSDAIQYLAHIVGRARAWGTVAIGIAILMASTWKQLVQSLYIGLTGREWIIKGSLFAMLVLLVALIMGVEWLTQRAGRVRLLFDALPWIVAAFATWKLWLSVMLAVRLYQRRLIPDRSLIAGAAIWAGVVFVVFAAYRWLLWGPHVPGYFLMLLSILTVPLVRLSATPLAFNRNRHQ
ncbi:MAG TPA: hypothetical protein VM100_03670 [Longimicrobiales bacterium]|nr:hypothetical protein [Longimicrobiales bacterium]